MRTMTISLLAGLLYSTLLFGQDSLNVERIGVLQADSFYFGGLELQDNLLYMHRHRQIVVIDVSSPESPTIINQVEVPGGIALSLDEDHLAVCADSSLVYLDVSNPEAPEIRGVYPSNGYLLDVDLVGSMAYVLHLTRGLLIIDFSEPENPTLLGEFFIQSVLTNVTVHDGIAYLSGLFPSRLYLVDVLDPANQNLITQLNTVSRPENTLIIEDILFVSARENGLRAYTLDNPFLPELLGVYNSPGVAADIQMLGDKLVLADRQSGVRVLDPVNLASIREIGYYKTPGQAIDVKTDDRGYIFVGDESNLGIYRYIPDQAVSPDQPALISNFNLSAPYPSPFNSTTVISLQTSFTGLARLSLSEISGRELRTWVESVTNPGNLQLSIDGTGLNAGTYWLRAEQNGRIAGSRLILVK